MTEQKPFTIDANCDELWAGAVLMTLFPERYSDVKWNRKDDLFDFVATDESKAIEVVSVTAKQLIECLKYEKALLRYHNGKGKEPDTELLKLMGTEFSEDKTIKRMPFISSNFDEMPQLERLLHQKEEKAKRRIELGQYFSEYELAICIHESPLYGEQSDYRYFEDFMNTVRMFTRICVITVLSVFYVNRGEMTFYDMGDYKTAIKKKYQELLKQYCYSNPR